VTELLEIALSLVIICQAIGILIGLVATFLMVVYVVIKTLIDTR